MPSNYQRHVNLALIMWDVDVAFFPGTATPGLFALTNPLFPDVSGDPAVVGRMNKEPRFLRAYWRAVQDAVNGPLQSTNLNRFLDPRYGAFIAYGVTDTANKSPERPDSLETFFRELCVAESPSVRKNDRSRAGNGTEIWQTDLLAIASRQGNSS